MSSRKRPRPVGETGTFLEDLDATESSSTQSPVASFWLHPFFAIFLLLASVRRALREGGPCGPLFGDESHVPPSTYSRTILSCVPITPTMAHLLEVCRTWPISPEVLDQLQAMPEWEEARAWGWMRNGHSDRRKVDVPRLRLLAGGCAIRGGGSRSCRAEFTQLPMSG